MEEHPWRFSTKVYRTFSVVPSCFINITNKEVDETGNCLEKWSDGIEALSFEQESPLEEFVPQPKSVKKNAVKKEVTDKSKGNTLTKKRKKKRLWHHDSDEDSIDFFPRKGGSSRFRRMVTNNNTLQSAYMCL